MMDWMKKTSCTTSAKVVLLALLAAASLLLLGGKEIPQKGDPVQTAAQSVARESASPERAAAEKLAKRHPVVLLRANVRKTR